LSAAGSTVSDKEMIMTIIIGIDPHKQSHTAVALDEDDRVLGSLRIDADRTQLDRLLVFAAPWPERIWAVENANGLGRLLSRQLLDADQQVIDVPAKLSARVRALSGADHKTDDHDARSTAIAARHDRALRPVASDDLTVLLGLLVERRWQIVSQRQKTLCRIHDQLVALTPGGASRQLSATKAAVELRRLRPADEVGGYRKQIARELLAELRILDRKRKEIDRQLDETLEQHGTTLTQIPGIGRVGAATLVSVVGDVTRFATAARFASFAGTAPIAASSGDKVRYRLNPGGHRQVNKILHTAAKVQRRLPGEGRDYIERRLAEGKSRAEATRALKRHLTNVVYRHMLADQRAAARLVSGEDKQVA
jgi:transposase